MKSIFKQLVLVFVATAFGAFNVLGQETKPGESSLTPKKEAKEPKPSKSDQPSKEVTGEQVAESVIFAMGGLGGRQNLQQIRKTSLERGKIQLVAEDGTKENVTYERRILRGDSLEKERIRLDQEFPNSRYALIYNENKIQGVYNDTVFTPREDATKAFQNQIWRGMEAILRYKENGSTATFVKREKQMGVEYYIVDITDKQGRTTRFAVSVKFLRVGWLEYTEDNVKYLRKFYDYRVAQGTLYPFRHVLYANDKLIEETNIMTVTFGQKVDEGLFQPS